MSRLSRDVEDMHINRQM